jgi:hypothetical protein
MNVKIWRFLICILIMDDSATNGGEAAATHGSTPPEVNENDDVLFYVPFVHNGYIIQQLLKGTSLESMTNTMMKWCPINLRKDVVRGAVKELKSYYEKLRKNAKNKGKDKFQKFMASEFVYPIETDLKQR